MTNCTLHALFAPQATRRLNKSQIHAMNAGKYMDVRGSSDSCKNCVAGRYGHLQALVSGYDETLTRYEVLEIMQLSDETLQIVGNVILSAAIAETEYIYFTDGQGSQAAAFNGRHVRCLSIASLDEPVGAALLTFEKSQTTTTTTFSNKTVAVLSMLYCMEVLGAQHVPPGGQMLNWPRKMHVLSRRNVAGHCWILSERPSRWLR